MNHWHVFLLALEKNPNIFSAACALTKRREDWSLTQKLELLRAHTYAFLCGQPLFFLLPVSSTSLAGNCLVTATEAGLLSVGMAWVKMF